MKCICLVVVQGGVAEVYQPAHVDCRVIDIDDVFNGGKPIFLPAGVGFEALAARAGLVNGADYIITEPQGEPG